MDVFFQLLVLARDSLNCEEMVNECGRAARNAGSVCCLGGACGGFVDVGFSLPGIRAV